ncbi:ABC transporter ATP-binding protein [Bradyrhizobium tropiciagri]|uniref:ABC transporter ATP-binding protein n=1 Tax=Bradyrhizobium tropiciagri TaxID=312253 RepID=UPI00067B46E2|nr:ABC transporter ATP-binding protein [Bradyrhizobium tropiciagri]
MISVRDVAVTFMRGTPNEMQALRGVTLSLAQEEFVTVIGSNGAGKSTLLNAIAGDVSVTAGTISIDDKDTTLQGAHGRAPHVARVFQDPMAGTCGSLSIEENLALAARRGQRRTMRSALRTSEKATFRERLAKLGLGLERRLEDRVGLLSGGQRQAVSLLMATLAPSRILLLDEHSAALDPQASATVLSLTDQFVRELKLTTLMITHSMRDALAYGNRIVMLHQGRIIFEASGAEKAKLQVPDLLERFAKLGSTAADNDRLLLN